jgi:ATP-dependent DNA helicase RecQ
LVLLRERIPHQNVTIDQSLYTFRKDQKRKMLDYFFQYLSTSDCRQRFILEYFSQKLEIDCGICENCRKKNKKKPSASEFKVIKADILLNLKRENIPIDKILSLFKEQQKEAVFKVLQYLLDEEIIIKKGDQIQLNH